MLLERERQLAVLRERLDAAEAGAGSLVLIGGEAGAGKTTLVTSFIDPLGTQAVVGACDPVSTPAPLSPLRDFHDVGDLANLDVFAGVVERFGRSAGSTVLVLEDIHWADQATLDFIRYMGRRVGDVKLVVLCTFRDDEVGPEHPLRTVLGQLARFPSTARLDVPMLTVDAVRRLTASTSLDPVELHALTGGNAFFVTEIVAGGGVPPVSLRDAVLARLDGLGPEVRRVVETISISPRPLDVQRTLALGNAAEAIDAAVAGGVIVPRAGLLGFRHELARSAVESSIPPARRYELHRAMLHLLRDDPAPDHARLAHHALAAADPELVAAHAPVAAREATSRGSTREAVALYEAVLDHGDGLAPDEAATLRQELGVQLIELDRPAEALVQLEAALAQFTAAGDRLRQADVLRQAGRAHGHLGDPAAAMRETLRAVELAERHEPSEQLVSALNTVASLAMLARRTRVGLPYAERAAHLAAELQLPRALISVGHTRACLEVVGGDADLGIELLTRAVEDAGELSFGDRLIALINLGSGAGEVRRYETAVDALVAAETFGVAHDLDASVAYARAWLARIAFERGRWDEAVAYASLVEATATNRSGYSLLTARGVLGRVRVRRGDPGGAELLAETLAGFEGHNLQYRWSPVAGLAEHHWLRGEIEPMIAVLSAPYEEALETESAWAQGELGYWLWKAEGLDANSPPPLAAPPYAAQIGERAEEAADLWARIGCPYEVALARSEGSPEVALEALATLDSLGAKPLADRVRAELRAAGVDRVPRGPSPATRANPWGLTDRQAEVLDLIVEGLSNSEIAGRLYVSKKTVEHHVSAVYAKLGVESRAQAMAAAR